MAIYKSFFAGFGVIFFDFDEKIFVIICLLFRYQIYSLKIIRAVKSSLIFFRSSSLFSNNEME